MVWLMVAYTPPALSREQLVGPGPAPQSAEHRGGAWPVASGGAGGRRPRNTVAGLWGMPPTPSGVSEVAELRPPGFHRGHRDRIGGP